MWSFCAEFEISIPIPVDDLRRVVFQFIGGKHLAQIDARMLLIEIEARAARFHLAADGGRYAAPGAFDLGEIFGHRADRAVLFDQAVHDIVERLEHVLVDADVPVAMRHDVVAGAGLGFGGRGQFVFFALRGDEIDLHFAIVLGAPFVAQLDQRVIGAGNPMVPHAERQRSGGETVFDVRGGKGGYGTERCALEEAAPIWTCVVEQM